MANAESSATGPLSSMSLTDTQYLIDLFQGHGCLWDIRTTDYRNRNTKRAAWLSLKVNLEAQTGIVCTVDNLQKKISSLRSNYTRELRLVNASRRSGAGKGDVRTVKWPYFEALQFLRPVINIQNKTMTNHSFHGESDVDQDVTTGEEILSTSSTSSTSSASISTSATTSATTSSATSALNVEDETCHKDVSGAKEKKRKRRSDSPDFFEKSIVSYLNAKQNTQSDYWHVWGQNLVSTISGIQNIRKAKLLRLDIDEIVNRALREELENEM